jgi:sugar lactone lactonase YvrE
VPLLPQFLPGTDPEGGSTVHDGKENSMNRYFALCALAALGLTVSAGAFVVRAAVVPLAPGTLITVAGNGQKGFSGDGGPGTQARLNNPYTVAMDAAGNLFIADSDNACVRRLSPDGMITTVAGIGGHPGFSGDGGPATQARLNGPLGPAIDAAGDLLISDNGNNRVRKVDPSGIITTVAGTGKSGFSGDGGPATMARLNGPTALAVDPMGDLFIPEWDSQRVRKVDPAGIITTVAGGGHPADGLGDTGPATDARLAYSSDVALDAAGNLYIVDHPSDNRVRRVSPDGKITTVAGGGHPADGVGDGGPATDARLAPVNITADPGGNLFISDIVGERVRKVSPSGIITTVAGTGEVGYSGDGGPAIAARLGSPNGVGLDRAGNLFLTECDLKPSGTIVRKGNMLVREVIGVAVPR